MAMTCVCDGCGKKEPAIDQKGSFVKPRDWYQRSDDDGTQIACSMDCVQLVADKSKKTGVVLPI